MAKGYSEQDMQRILGQNLPEMEGQKTFSNQFADYTIKEALCDDEIIYIIVEAKPKSEEYLLLPQDCIEEDDAGAYMNLAEAAGQTIQEYADSKGQQIVRSSVALFEGEELCSCSLDEQHLEDGTVYYCITGTNNSETENVILNCVGLAYTKGMSVAERAENECTLFNRNNSVSTKHQMAEESLETERGIVVESIEISETELGLYAEFTYHKKRAAGSSVGGADSEQENTEISEGLLWNLVNSDGTQMKSMPYYSGTGTVDNGHGTFSVMMAYQKPENAAGLAVVVKDVESDIQYGPYEIVAAEN